MKSGKQINLYLTEDQIKKIEKYLTDKGLLFVEDKILSEANPLFINYLYSEKKWARYIIMPFTNLDYMTWENEGKQNFRVQGMCPNLIDFSCMGYSGDLYRISFYYSTYFSDESQAHNPEFEALVNAFFRWLRKNYQRVPQMPTFYQNPAQPVSVPF
jgi:hypothetical protein